MLKAVLEFDLSKPVDKKIFRLASKAENFGFALEEYFSWLESLTENDFNEFRAKDYKKELEKCLEAFEIKL